MSLHAPSRREAMLGAGALFAWSYAPKLARAEGRDPRVLVVVLRGALDGLGVVAPIGDPDWVKLRGDKALVVDGKLPALPLDSFFALNPAMPNLHRLYQARQATIVHACATPYRERSHFDGQDILESGFTKPGFIDSGWLNRALTQLGKDGRVNPQGSRAFAVGPLTPLVVRGPAPVMSWVPQQLLPASDDTRARVLDLYRHTDLKLAGALEGNQNLVALTRDAGASLPNQQQQAPAANPMQRVRASSIRWRARQPNTWRGRTVHGSARWVLSVGIRTSTRRAGGALANLLGALDGAIAAFEQGMGPAWNETVVVLITEFGRTARINGDDGTDHGTGTVALLTGGALQGGRVIADWPGLKPNDLHENRDLKPTTDLRAVLKGVLRDHLRLDERALATTIFPGSDDVKPISGLLT